MPATQEERGRVVLALSRMELAPDTVEDIVWADGERITEAEQSAVFMLAVYTIQRNQRYDKAAQRKALRLLPAFLTPSQLRQMRTCKYFHVVAPSGSVYRLYPYRGRTRGVERHKTRYFETRDFCLHDYPRYDEREMPPADLCIAHLLWLLSDEQAFLTAANATPLHLSMWNGDWRRQLNAAQRERAGQAQSRGTGQ